MVGVWRSVKQKVVGTAAVVVLLAGGAVAAVSATGQSNSRGHARADCASHRHHARERDLSAAAAYLGVSHASLKAQLRSGKTLAQIADATPGKSTARLVAALVAARRGGLADATAAGRLTEARLAKRVARLDKRMNALVRRNFARAGSA